MELARAVSILHASTYIDLGCYAAWKDEFLRSLFSNMLGIGLGCDTCPEGQLLVADIKEKMSDMKMSPTIDGIATREECYNHA